MAPLIIIEEMNKEELLFIKKKLQKEQALMFRTMRNLSFLCFIIPTIVAILFFTNEQKIPDQYAEELPEPFTMYTYLYSVLSLLTLLFLGGFISYIKSIKTLKKDVELKTKVIEPVLIIRKKFMDINNSYYFYLRSRLKLSIEVTEQVYHQYEEGDEINIEYSRFGKEYFGYF